MLITLDGLECVCDTILHKMLTGDLRAGLAGGRPHGLRTQERGLGWRRGLEASAYMLKAAGRSTVLRQPSASGQHCTKPQRGPQEGG